ncbi:MAG: winged helix-turn-helix domain-containing protein [Xanthomonadales bacterium]|nr:winged helix-turn-helix domain-containing protein [Xanthomonadales bacterium]
MHGTEQRRPGGSLYRFGRHRLDPARREFWQDGEIVPLTPQVFDCLAYLIAHPERAIGRDELIAAVWGRVDVTDTLLGQTIMHARRAVGDNGTAQRSIRTVPRFGYRWVDESVTVVDGAQEGVPCPDPAPTMAPESADEPVPGEVPAARAGGRPRGRRSAPGLALVALALAGLAVLAWVVRGDVPFTVPVANEPAANPRLVLVVPATVGPGDDHAWMPLGIMDAVAGELRLDGWPVVPSATAVALGSQAGTKPAAWISDASGANLVVHPEILRTGDLWRVRLRLDGGAGLPGHIDAGADELLDAARLAGARLLAALKARPLPELARHDPDFAASQLLQRVEAELLAGRIEAAEARMADAPPELLQRPELRLQAAAVEYRAGRLESAEAAYRQVLDLPSAEGAESLRARSLLGLGSIARTRGRFGDAVPHYEAAIALLDDDADPESAGVAHASLGASLSGLGRYDEAMAELARARVLLGTIGDAQGLALVDSARAAVLADRGRLNEAAPLLRDAITRYGQLGMIAERRNQQLALAEVHRELLEHAAALETAEEAWQWFAGQPSSRLYPIAAATRIGALLDVGKIQEARQLAAGLSTAALSEGYQTDRLRLALADLELQGGRWIEAERGYASAIGGAALPDEMGFAWLQRLRVLRLLDRDADVAAVYAAATTGAPASDANDAPQCALAALLRAEQAWATADREAAWRHYGDALRCANARGAPALITLVALSYGRALIGDARLADAAAIVGQVAPWAEHDYDAALLHAEFHRKAGDQAAWKHWLETAAGLAGERAAPAWLVAPIVERPVGLSPERADQAPVPHAF